MILQVYRVISLPYFIMSKLKVGEYFNPSQHLVFHQDKKGGMIGGGYQVNNLLYQNKMPLFVSSGENSDGIHDSMMSGGSGWGNGGGDGPDRAENKHFIPEKFSDLFQDLAVPAGLFMMPALFRPRNYAFEVNEDSSVMKNKSHKSDGDGDTDSDSDSDSENTRAYTKQVPSDIFDTLLSLVTPNERIHHDVKTRRRRGGGGSGARESKRKNKTRRGKLGMAQAE